MQIISKKIEDLLFSELSAHKINFMGSKDYLRSRIDICIGFVEKVESDGYLPLSIIPKRTWRKIENCEFEALYTCKEPEIGNTVSIIPAIDFNKLPSLSKNIEDISNILEPNILPAMDKLVANYSLINPIFLGLASNKPNQETVTFEQVTKKKIGLHVDSFDNADINQRKNSRNRISINIAKCPRYLIFINLTLSGIVCFIQSVAPFLLTNVKIIEPSILPYLLFLTKHNYPILRIRIDPGEAYIAPTENIIHDGSTFGISETSVTGTYLGKFKHILG